MTARSVRAPLIAAIAATSLAALAPEAQAQRSFEGIVTFRAEGGESITYYVRDGVLRAEMPFGGEKHTMIMDPRARTVTMLIPGERSYMQMAIPADAPDDPSDDVKITKLGKSEIVAGHSCQYVRVTDESGNSADVCAASDLGRFMAPMGGPQGGGRGSAWQRLAGQDLFPLKVIASQSGKPATVLEATKVERKSLDPSLFAPPAGYQKMSMPGMPGMRRGP